MLSFRVVRVAVLTASALVSSRTAQAQGPVHVIITLRGDVGQYAGMCGSGGGEDKLTGNLELVSYDAEDGTALYQGTLDRNTAVYACGTKPNPTPDQVKMCSATLNGTAKMNVTLEVYEDDRGAWVKSNPLTGPGLPVTKRISGCAEPAEWLNDYPNDGIMSGLSFEDVPSGYLQARRYGTPALELVVTTP